MCSNMARQFDTLFALFLLGEPDLLDPTRQSRSKHMHTVAAPVTNGLHPQLAHTMLARLRSRVGDPCRVAQAAWTFWVAGLGADQAYDSMMEEAAAVELLQSCLY